MTFVTTHIASCPYPMDHSKLCCCPGGEQEIAALKAEIAELRKALEDTKRKAMQPLARYLAKQYNDGQAVEIARLCDDELDRTGNLLGWVREEAITARRALGGMT